MTEEDGVSGVVLAGGLSQRMGRNKALMLLGGQPMIGRVLGKLAQLCDDLIISANEKEPYARFPARVVADILPVPSPLSGIHAGLTAIRNDRAIVVACDMPFLSLPFLRYMTVVAPGYDVVVPRWGEYYEPLHAVYGVDCIKPIERLLAGGPQRIVSLYRHVHVREITEETVRLFDAERSFFNVNTPEDWDEAQQLHSDRGP